MGLIDKIKNFIYSDNSEYDEQMDDGYAEEESDAGSSSSSSSASDFSSFFKRLQLLFLLQLPGKRVYPPAPAGWSISRLRPSCR